MRLHRRHAARPGIADLTPLVDVALMLVVFLLLTAQTVGDTALPIRLPLAQSSGERPQGDLEIVISADGTLSVEGSGVDLAALPQLAQGRARAILHADRDASHGRVVAVEDALLQAGVAEIFYATGGGDGDEW